jgi:ABC-type uncharacterized transport system permease subunit
MAVLLTAALAIVAYSISCAVYASDVYADRDPTGTLSRVMVHAAVALNAVFVGLLAMNSGVEGLLSGGNVLALSALVLGTTFLVVRERWPVRVAGALVTPVAALLIGAWMVSIGDHPGGHAPSLIITVHVGLAIVGMSTFAVAAVLSVLYLVQERQLRRREFGRLFHRLPSLDVLDEAGFRLVSAGFVIYLVAVVLGVMTSLRGGQHLDARSWLGIGALVVFGAIVGLRITAGWRGAQAARLTIAGCLTVLLVLALYTVGAS